MSRHGAVAPAPHDPLRDAASAAFAAALLKVAGPVEGERTRADLLHTAATLASETRLTEADQTLLKRLLTVVGDDESAPERIRRGVIATYRGLRGSRS